MRMRIVLVEELEEGAPESELETAWLPDGMVQPPAGLITINGDNFHVIGFLWETWEAPIPPFQIGDDGPIKYVGAKLIVMNKENAQKFGAKMQRQQGAGRPLILPAGGQPFGLPAHRNGG